ncbi:unnamed protein product [Phaedon cochleariae]|uniref:Tudor domain-containing protein n=1 Tax=Phaedon cochleariae TaxID=80249 RepID=A0A9N9X418_PHACE|nr:unnamed protein product [Phaedon cochleariae]
MAPTNSRQLLAWTLPTIAVLLSYFWYKKRRIGGRSDPGEVVSCCRQTREEESVQSDKSSEVELSDSAEDIKAAEPVTPQKGFLRSLSGVESTPIDIVVPRDVRSPNNKSLAPIVTDDDLDLEIEKIKSMKNGALFGAKSETSLSPPPLPSVKEAAPAPSVDEKKKRKQKVAKNGAGKMAQKDIAVVEEKLATLHITNDKEMPHKATKREHKTSTGSKRDDQQRHSTERDSANHSPSDVMLASPSLSSISDNHSEGSNDSGKGGSDAAPTPPPPSSSSSSTAAAAVSSVDLMPSFYEFVMPQHLVGKLIGRHGAHVAHIKEKTDATIIVRQHPNDAKLKVCSIEGTETEIAAALKMVRDKFPAKRYADVTLERVHFTAIVPSVPLIPDHLYLKLVEGINNDTILSCIVTPNHLFLQQPTHPSFPNLNVLGNYMNACYSEAESPFLPSPIPENTVCAAYSVDAWYRATVLGTDEAAQTSYVKFLDYGGFAHVENSKLRQIRGDFMLLPFQAAECMLANVVSASEDGSWPEEAYNLVADVAKGSIMYTQVADYTENGTPLVLIYIVVGPQSVIFLNQHLVDMGFAEWVPQEDVLSLQDGTDCAKA